MTPSLEFFMRTTLPSILALAALTAGCAPLDASMQRTGSIYFPTQGVALFDDGQRAHAGMMGSTCALSTSGSIGDDRSVQGDGPPKVLGSETHHDTPDDVVLVRTRDRLHVISSTPISGDTSDLRDRAEIDVPALGSAVLTADHVVTTSNCTVSWYDHDLGLHAVAATDLSDCVEPGLAVDPLGGNAWIANNGQVQRVQPNGAVHTLPEPADSVVFSAQTGDLLLTRSGGDTVRAVDWAGDLQWSAAFAEPIHQVVDFEGSGFVVVVTAQADSATMILLDANTGRIDREIDLPVLATVSTSADGRTLALERPNSTQFFRLR